MIHLANAKQVQPCRGQRIATRRGEQIVTEQHPQNNRLLPVFLVIIMALVFTILGGGCARKAEPPVEVPPDEDIK